jgi:hypothetical protein
MAATLFGVPTGDESPSLKQQEQGADRRMATALGKKRVVGLILLVGILAVFLSFNRFPKLDTVRED